MKILALESSAKACSVALLEDSQVLAQVFLNNGNTHSKTLLPAIDHILTQCDTPLEEIDTIAVAIGPGSFTGLRIGVSTAKGLAFAHETPCAACSTLISMAWQLNYLEDHTVIPVMDARKKQVYHGKFLIKNQIPQRLCPDSPLSLDELKQDLEHISTPIILIGDGANLAFDFLKDLPNIEIAPLHFRQQSALGVGLEGFSLSNSKNLVSHETLEPIYLRLSQAERERLEKMK